jgi:transcriptional regulator with XRE-family HTH domain
MSALVKQLKQEFANDKEYRHSYAEEFLNASIATQIKVLREMREWRQADLARESEMKQSVISRLENVDYSSWSLKSLKQLSRAFDVRLVVRFERFKDLVLEADKFGRSILEVPEFKNDLFFGRTKSPERLETSSVSALTIVPEAEVVPEAGVFEKDLVAGSIDAMRVAQTFQASQYEFAVGG